MLRIESTSESESYNSYLAIILSLVHGKNDLRRHPVRRADKTVGWTRNTGRTEVGQLDVTRICYQNIASFYIPVINSNLSCDKITDFYHKMIARY